MFGRSFDLVGSSIVACAAVAVAFAPGVPTVVRVLLGLPLVLVLPGYTLTALATPSLGRGRWGADKILFSLGTSISVAVLGGLVLNFTPWGLERRSWSLLLAVFTIVAAMGAVVRRAGATGPPSAARRRAHAVPLLFCVVAALIASAAVGISRRGALQTDQQSTFSQLSMLPTSGNNDLRIDVTNHEGATQHYRIVLHAGNRQLSDFQGITLAAGDTWSRTVRMPTNLPSRTRIEADLYRATSPHSVYRHVTYWSR